MNHSEITPGTTYASLIGPYVVTASRTYRNFTDCQLEPVGHDGAPFTTRVVDQFGPREWRWTT